MKERSLLVFTLLAQMAVGAFWVAGALRIWAARTAGAVQADLLTRGAQFACAVVMVLALLVSLFHLGAPKRAWRALGNLQSSWLSREVLLGVVFTCLVCVFIALQRFELGSIGLRNAIELSAGAVGLVFVYAMANVYRLRTVPSWNRWTTPASFFATALLLGGLGVGAVLATDSGGLDLLARSALSGIAIGSTGLLLVELLLALAEISRSAAERTAVLVADEDAAPRLRSIRNRRLVLITLSVPVTGAVFVLSQRGAQAAGVAVFAFWLVLASEVLGRMLFYLSKVRVS